MYKIINFPCASAGIRRCLSLSSKFSSNSSDLGQNYYQVLGLEKSASNDEIKRAYYEQSKKYHPDRKQGSQDRFREISSAYEVLGNPRLRKMYDRGIIAGGSGAIYEADSSTDSEESGPPFEPDSISIPSLDKWSKEHYSDTFARDQKAREKLRHQRQMHNYKAETKGAVGTFWIFAMAFGILGYMIETTRAKEAEKEKPPKS